jgi:hypothetical protein
VLFRHPFHIDKLVEKDSNFFALITIIPLFRSSECFGGLPRGGLEFLGEDEFRDDEVVVFSENKMPAVKQAGKVGELRI